MIKLYKITSLLIVITIIICTTNMIYNHKKYNSIYQMKWTKAAKEFDNNFFKTPEAVRIGNNLLLFQKTSGGWPKNTRMQDKIPPEIVPQVMYTKDYVSLSTVDNDATTTEIRYLARLYNVKKDKKYKQAVISGINYLLQAQYKDSGGFPQYYPADYNDYHLDITFNDNAIINILKIMQEITKKKYPFNFLDDTIVKKAKIALDKGIDCILKTQIIQNGELTGWCGQYDSLGLFPLEGRAYEPIAIYSKESANILLFLMSLKNPSQEIINAIENGVAWFEKSKITGKKLTVISNVKGEKDITVTQCEECPPIWARFYDIDSNQPIFSDRTNKIYNKLEDIDYERRNNYDWYFLDGDKVFEKYKKWKKNKKRN